ncbi:uncharacterized protein [Henckelia pumila]|uniref:uncharacterized protein n=1 Tax=Henckelia pumila TaxID=405737 RepID=UPI003C6DD594
MISCREYYCYKLQIRDNFTSVLFYGGRLLQQFVVDMYVKLETTRLDYYRRNQAEMRSELYQGIVDSVVAGESRGSEVGRRIVLPASFIGGPHDMRRRYLDAIALVRTFGKPDLFITMTCNPEWSEITTNLFKGQRAQDRPDLTSRVFRAKLLDLKDQILRKAIFGTVSAYVYVVEFQKKGLPHAHMLVILKQEHKINTVDLFDCYVSAEVPDQDIHPRLHSLVVRHMMHGPCGHLNEKNSCMIRGQCKNHYPRQFVQKSTQGQDGYPYRRRDYGGTVDIRGAKLNSQWVVPYNPYLLYRYDCHLNVEVCSGLTAVKYLYKYIYKGHDKIGVNIVTHDTKQFVDEIRNFQDARWVSAQEAMWRIYEFDLNEISPAVINLPLHLPNKHCITFWRNQNLQSVLNLEQTSKTMLTEFFNFCAMDDEAKKFLYSEFPEHYVWDMQGKFWSKRKQRKVIGRVNAAHPVEGEIHYLRLLLLHVRGPTSFNYLLTFNNRICFTFKEAAQKRGFLECDRSNFECLNEAAAFQMPYALRRLFATILIHCEPADVRNLWNSFYTHLNEDFQRQHGLNDTLILYETIRSVAFFLESMGKKIESYDLPRSPIIVNSLSRSVSREIMDEMYVQVSRDDLLAKDQLNVGQRRAFDMILQCFESGNSGLFFVNGPGGTGKTFLYRALLAHVRSQNMIALATTTSGVAASILPGGRTAHSRFKIPIELHEKSFCTISKQTGLAELLRVARLIIWDEAPMAKRFAIEAVDRTLQDIVGVSKPFGGKVVVLGGDFMQVLPVIPKASVQETINGSLVKSYLYKQMKQLVLFENMRARTDPAFGDFLLRVGKGIEPTDGCGNIQIPDEMVIKFDDGDVDSSEQKLIDNIFPDLVNNCHSSNYMTDRAILASKNSYVDKMNEKIISLFPGEVTTFLSYDEAVDDTQNFYPEEFLNSLEPNGMPPHRLLLKKNCPIMLLRNLDPSDGLYNGTRMVCREFKNNVIHTEITVGHHAGKKVFIPRIPLSPPENEGYPFHFRRKQFPVRLCFAMTINKAQGQTIPIVGIYLPEPMFSHGQLYVAISRGTSMANTKVLIMPDAINSTDNTRTKNIVYTEVLQCMS